ncbi:C25 family cysteine peptidase [Aurantibacillus circumpalustris]|uniref:putative type IX secretion system sortase PorU2 n=1 Tax=Aurantibacillus circumpalustris TaxID=3036359 RepID=UPI00295ACE98|nr:C25 family cysteine peptidase [Aurantibacillus circumpalustris]
MRQLSFLAIFVFFSIALSAQKYCNEWINFSQKYFKIPIVKEGLYRIDSITLANYYNLNSVNPKNFQLFFKGKEQHLFIQGESDGAINSGDFIEFYVNPIMGDLDSLAYTDIKYVPNPYTYLFNDTIYAFLTTNNSITNKRYILETDINFSGYPQVDYFYTEKVFTQRSSYNPVEEYSYGSADPRYTQAEGYGISLGKGASYSFPATGLNTYTTTSLPFYISLNYSGQSIAANYTPDHQIQLIYNDQNNSLVLLNDTSFYGYKPIRKTFTLSSQNTNNSTSITFSSIAAPSFTANNATMIHYVNYFYPHTTDLNSQSFFKLFIDNHPNSNKSYFNFSNFNSGSGNAVLLDVTNGKRISNVVTGSQVEVIIPNGSGKKTCILIAEKDTIVIKKLSPVNQSGNFINYKNQTANKPYVLIYHKSLENSAMAYKSYRKSISGGSYDVIDADIETLYEQFSYGVKKNPLAIRHFVKYLKDSLANVPNYVFLIGKGVSYPSGVYQDVNLIPTIGIPSCDNLLTTELSTGNLSDFLPEIPVGRLATLTNSEVTLYLNKIQQHESTGQADWKKRILHFVGGDDEVLNATLSGYMSNFALIASDSLFGGDVLTFQKNTTSPIQTNISDSIKGAIANGASLFTFFGHGSEQGFDQAIDDPELYNNAGKYPLVIANSCYSGDIHVPTRRSVSERFVFANQKGSIGFISTTSYGFDYALNNYTREFYKAFSYSRYNTGIGDMMKEAILQNANQDLLTKLVAMDMTLHGDPAVKVSNGVLPDYQIFANDVSFDLKKYTDSIGINIHYKNLGKSICDSFYVRIERFLPNGDSATYFKRIPSPMYKDSFKIFVNLDFTKGIGLNKFKVYLDYLNEIVELTKSNNTTPGSVDLFVPGGDVLPVYPYKYAIVPTTPTITLKASTTNPFAPSTTYRMQLDTSDTFNHLITTTLITSTGGVLEWKVNLPYGDSTVYYWRVSKDSTAPTSKFVWKESSFQTIGTKRGWGQSHFNQFKSDVFQFVNYKKTERKFIFENNKHSLSCRDAMAPVIEGVSIGYYFNNITLSNWSCAPEGWNFVVFDSISGLPQKVQSLNFPTPGAGTYNNCVCVPRPLNFYSFGTGNYCGLPTATWQMDVENFLNAVPVNNYVLAFTVGDSSGTYAQIPTYSNSLYTAFEKIGANTIRTTSDDVPYILFGQKGMSAGQGHELKGTSKKSIIYLEDSIKTRWHSGYVSSEIIGPSYKWNSLHWRVKSSDGLIGDTTVLKLVGIQKNGQIDTLASFKQDSSDVINLSSYVDAINYPNIKLIAYMHDNINRTSPQLQHWQVLYDEAPECAINPLKGFASINDSLQEGDEVTFKFPIENIGVKDFTDSLVVTYWIENKDFVKIPLAPKLKAGPFTSGQIIVDTVKINTLNYKGSNALWIFVNPLNDPHYQYEQSQFNNIGRYPFNVTTDITNPLLDVTFDGIRILNGDIVSAKPSILITLKDENKFLALNDTSAFTIFLQTPNQGQQRIYFSEQLRFTPANLPKNSCSINYNPIFPLDGKYTLIVQAKDRSKNVSGAREYRVQFEVNTRPSVTQVMNYPNPFTTSTRFVFTLTGSEIPEVFTIQIMTITGKIVKEITRAELGNLHIGRNITDYAWDGRDNFGDRLANGVYLYRVITKLNGQTIERNSSGADKFFTKDFGKMVLMR